MIDPTTHVSHRVRPPDRRLRAVGIASGPDGNLWFTEFGSEQIGRINPTTHAITETSLPTAGSKPDGITAGPDGNLWFTEASGNRIGSINPVTQGIAETTVPTAGRVPRRSRRARTATSGSPRTTGREDRRR